MENITPFSVVHYKEQHISNDLCCSSFNDKTECKFITCDNDIKTKIHFQAFLSKYGRQSA